MNIRARPVSIAALTLLLGACASTPRDAPDMAQARAEVQRVSADPLAGQVAAVPLDAARSALQAAQKQSGDQREQSLFEANHNAQIAEAMVRTAHARAQVDDAERQRNQVLMQARENEAARARADAQAQAARAAAANSQAAAANSQAAAASSEAEQLRQQSEQYRQQTEQLRQQMEAMHAQQTARGMVMTLPDVLFDTGRATLNPGANSALDQVAGFLKGNAQFKVRVEGHTDSVGSAEFNQRLSEQRAASVRDALTGRSVPADQVTVLGKGMTMPVASNKTAAGRQQNRRVEIVFSDQQGQFAGERGAASAAAGAP